MHDFILYFLNSPYGPMLWTVVVPVLVVLTLWTIVLKGFALWHSARASQKWWFIALLVINTVGILEIVYLIWFRPNGSHSLSTPTSSPA